MIIVMAIMPRPSMLMAILALPIMTGMLMNMTVAMLAMLLSMTIMGVTRPPWR